MNLSFLKYFITTLLLGFCVISQINAHSMTASSPRLEPTTLPNHWINGENCTTEPKAQINEANKNLYIIRQSVCTNFEAPFIFLIFGQDKVLLLDTGASDFGQRKLVDKIIQKWSLENHKSNIPLVVIHTHGHGDHVAGDKLFEGRANTTIIKKDVHSVIKYFGFNDWPQGISTINLGKRELDVIPLPGHQTAHIALYDRNTGILFTGDSLYPGRLYFKQSTFSQYKKSMLRLYQWAKSKNISYILGNHIEMTNIAGVDYPFEAIEHKNERKLQLTLEHLKELVEAVTKMQLPVKKQVHNDFILYPTD